MERTPQRVQRRRIAGQPGIPAGARYVGRPSKWGNPWVIVKDGGWYRVQHITEDRRIGSFVVPEYARKAATNQFRSDLLNDRLDIRVADVERELHGLDLCCWCPPAIPLPSGRLDWLGLMCHGDVLLEVARG